MLDEGARMLLVDTQADNIPAIRFFEKLGFIHPQPCVYLSRNLTEPEPTEQLSILNDGEPNVSTPNDTTNTSEVIRTVDGGN